MLTKEEAKGKLCPYAMSAVDSDNNDSFVKCSANECMAWKWTGYKCEKCNTLVELSSPWKLIKAAILSWLNKANIFERHGAVICTKCSTNDKEVKAVPVGYCKRMGG